MEGGAQLGAPGHMPKCHIVDLGQHTGLFLKSVLIVFRHSARCPDVCLSHGDSVGQSVIRGLTGADSL